MNQPVLTLALCALFGGLFPRAAVCEEPAPARNFRKGVVIRVEGIILPQLEGFVNRKLDQAQGLGADLVILEIASPGGALEVTLELADRLRDLQWAHTVAYIPREALSGAAILALACDEIVMGPQARMGDAGPVFQGPDALFRHAPEKVRSDLALRVRDLAEARGRPPALAEAMVDLNLEVFQVVDRDTQQSTFMSQAELDASPNPDRWEKGPLVLESRAGAFLEVNGPRAVELGLAEGIVDSRLALATRFGIGEPLVVLTRTLVDNTVDILNFPLVTGLLFVIGAIALYVELSAPGIGMGGLISGLCFALFFWSRFLGGTAGWLELILVLSGVAFLAVELFVIPGFGVPGVTGLILILIGIIMAGQNHLVPQSPRAMSQLGTSLIVLFASGGVFLVAAAFVSRYYGSVPILNRLVLASPAAATRESRDESGKPLPPTRHFQAGVGDWGVAESPLRPAGKAIFGDEYLDVVTDGSYVDRGRQVRIIQISGNRIVVREIEDPPTENA
jgi:membrane-bound serine protease (ClpP class)